MITDEALDAIEGQYKIVIEDFETRIKKESKKSSAQYGDSENWRVEERIIIELVQALREERKLNAIKDRIISVYKEKDEFRNLANEERKRTEEHFESLKKKIEEIALIQRAKKVGTEEDYDLFKVFKEEADD